MGGGCLGEVALPDRLVCGGVGGCGKILMEGLMMKIEKTRGSRVGVNRRSSFTLIELLVVVAVILILMGISLKVMGIVNRKASTGKTTWILEQVKNALGAYYSLYGTYPPVDSVAFVYEGSIPSPTEVLIPASTAGWSTGLVYYIYSTDSHHNQEAKPWQHYLEGIGGIDTDPKTNITIGAWRGGFTNKIHSISDAWGQTLRYKSYPPDYQRFLLYSIGPNGSDQSGGGDDIGVQSVD
jgi:prepilin-type N-terminal cleavage/methylation domain-containing protein